MFPCGVNGADYSFSLRVAKPDYNFRANCSRSVSLIGELTDSLINTLLAQITALRFRSKDPITVYINSPGGSIRCLEILSSALRSRDADGNRCRVVTCASGDAASAAATMLVLGDYAIVHPHSVVHFHGVRMSDNEITVEGAAMMADYLHKANHRIAGQLSEMLIPRVIFRYIALQREFAAVRKELNNPGMSDLDCYTECITRRTTAAGDRVVKRALARLRRSQKLSPILFKLNLHKEKNALRQDAKVLRQVIAYEIRQNKDPEWRLDDEGIAQIFEDYSLLRDVHLGGHRSTLQALIEVFGPDFLDDPQLEKYSTLKQTKPDEAAEMLNQNVAPLLEPLWYYTVCMARFFQSGENRLTATDAYWLGAVDEVVGTELHGMRQVVEADAVGTPSTTP